MGTNGLVIFDGDDTLWAVEHLYDAAIEDAARAVAAAGLPGEEWRILQRELDLRNVRTLGMSKIRFPLSSEQALAEVARGHGVQPSAELVAAVVDASSAVFTMRAPLMPGAEDALAALSPHFDLALLTKGDPAVQQFRIGQSGLARWFDYIEIVPEKDDAVFMRLVQDAHASPAHSWSVGNSLASDVNPALRVGLNAIWIDAHVWEHERREVAPAHPRLILLDRLDQIADTVLATAKMETHRP